MEELEVGQSLDPSGRYTLTHPPASLSRLNDEASPLNVSETYPVNTKRPAENPDLGYVPAGQEHFHTYRAPSPICTK